MNMTTAWRVHKFGAPVWQMPPRLDSAKNKGCVLRYVGSLDAFSKRAAIGLIEMEMSHPFANIN